MEKRSPLREKPLRAPGESVDETRRQIFVDRVAVPVTLAGGAIVLAALEWFRAYADVPPQPWAFTVLAVMAAGYAAYRVRQGLPQLKALQLASLGEKSVGQMLETLRKQGYQVFHDVIGPGFNIDHVLIGPAGVFTIETKTHRKRPNAKVLFDGETLTIDGRKPDRNPVVQAQAQARWLSHCLEESTGCPYRVKPVILFPGWWVEQTGRDSMRHTWVLAAKALPGFLGKTEATLDLERVSQASFHLSRIIRAA